MAEVRFPDNPKLLRTPRAFAGQVLDGELDAEEISRQLSNLLGFAKNFYLQFFDFEFELKIHNLDQMARKAVRPIERKLRTSKGSISTLRLISHFVTLVEFLEEDDATEYDERGTADRRRRILEDISELLERIAEWAADRNDLPRLRDQAQKVAAEFVSAAETIDTELGYEDDDD
jgi:hypothetical protein